MADQGLLGQSRPAGTTNTVLYDAPVDQSASAVLTISNDGTGAAYDVAIKDCNQVLTLDASTYKLHRGDVITGYRFTLGTPLLQSLGLIQGTTLTSSDGEKTAVFESYFTPAFTEITVKNVAVRLVTLESVSGTFAVGDTLTKGSGGDTTTATVFAVTDSEANVIVHVGPSTINGSGSEFADGDSVSGTGGASGTVSTGGVGTANNEFTFTESGGTESLFNGVALNVFNDRTYRFNVADSSMSSKVFKLSTTVNGEYGPDGDIATTGDNGAEYTTGKTTNGTAGSSGAYVQYDFSANTSPPTQYYFYEGTTGSNAGAGYGGSDRLLTTSSAFSFTEIFIVDKDGTWVDNSDTFTFGGTTFTVTAQTAGPYGVVADYTGTALKVIKGPGSADFAGSDTFQDNPKLAGGARTTATVSSVTTATTAVGADNYLVKDKSLSANGIDKITSLVIGPGESLIVESATQNNTFSLIGFQDASTAIAKRFYDPNLGGGG